MSVTLHQLAEWMRGRENEHLEFKEARSNFHFEKLVKYCAALANEGGGVIVLGVTDRRPRRVVGSSVFPALERTKAGLIARLRLRIQACELQLIVLRNAALLLELRVLRAKCRIQSR